MMVRTVLLCLLFASFFYLSGCSGCSRSGSHQPRRAKRSSAATPVDESRTGASRTGESETGTSRTETPRPAPPETPSTRLKQIGDGPTEVAMEKENGVYKVPVTVNGVPMKFILDTGASLISISATEADFLMRQGAITNRDIVGQSRFQDANGDISPGAIIRLRSVQIGDRVLENVNANVVQSMKAPLLLGQSALSKFGKISVDYRRNIVTFE